MNRVIHVIKALLFGIVFLLGLFFILEFFTFTNWKFVYRFIADLKAANMERSFLGLTGVILMLLPIVVFYGWFHRKKSKQSLLFINHRGSIRLSLAAISQFVDAQVLEHRHVDACRSKILKRSRGVFILVELDVYPLQNVQEISEEIQEKVRTSVEELLGIEEVIGVSVRISGIITERIL